MDPIHRLKTATVHEFTMAKSEYIPISFSSALLALVMVWQIALSKNGHGNVSDLTSSSRALLLSHQDVEFIFLPLELSQPLWDKWNAGEFGSAKVTKLPPGSLCFIMFTFGNNSSCCQVAQAPGEAMHRCSSLWPQLSFEVIGSDTVNGQM